MKKFLVLGIGNAQVDLLLYLRTLETFEVHALSNSPNGRGFQFADIFETIDITNKDAVLNYAEKEKIDYIYSVGSDAAMPTVAYVAEKLGINTFTSYNTAYTCNNKNLFREKLSDCYGSVPHVVVHQEKELTVASQLTFPVIVKPVDSQGQRGVGTANSIEGVHALYKEAKSHSRSGKVIIEEKIIGEEISVNVYLLNGEIVFFLPSGRISWEQFDGGIIHKHYLPSQLSSAAEGNVLKLVKDSLAKLEIDNGPAYFQIKMDSDIPYLIEVTPRFDGCHMWRLIKNSCGIDLLEIAVQHLTDGQCQNVNKARKIIPFCLEFHCMPPNESFTTPEVDPNAVYDEMYYEEGECVRKMNGKMEKCGYKVYPL
ncbi:ATP-grasp domain-containing protein [Vibrio lentus]